MSTRLFIPLITPLKQQIFRKTFQTRFQTRFQKLMACLVTTVYLLLSTLTWADDTDIYLHNPNLDSSVKPNVLFILDTSGSMAWDINGNSNPGPHVQSRMEIMQEAFGDIMQNSSNINVGIMTLAKDSTGSRLVFPVTDIDQDMGTGIILDSSPAIKDSWDDGYEETDGSVNLFSDTLALGGNYLTALRFQVLGVPRGARIESATIEFTAAESNDSGLTLEIQAGTPGTGADDPFKETNSNLSQRARSTSGLTLWSPEPWKKGDKDNPARYSVDVKTLLQTIVNDTHWCGNDTTAFFFSAPDKKGERYAYSFDGDKTLKPRLVVEYSGGESGCKNDILDTRIQHSGNDAYEGNNGNINATSNLLLKPQNTVALQYQKLPIKQGAHIIEASLTMTINDGCDSNKNNKADVFIQAEDTDSSAPFRVAKKEDLSRRKKTSAKSAPWDGRQWQPGSTYVSPDISHVLQEVIDRKNWQPGNNLTLLLSINMEKNSHSRCAVSYDQNPTLSPRLNLKVTSGGTTEEISYLVKEHLVSLVNNLKHDGGTPLTPTYYDAAVYFQKDNNQSTSPIKDVCQSNYIAMLTDGEANSNESSDIKKIKQLTGDSKCDKDASSSGEKCARTLADWIYSTDLAPDMNGLQNAYTHTIAFAAKGNKKVKAFMSDIATNGGGNFYEADEADELSDAFNQIITGILEDESSYVSPGVSANQFNNSRHLSQAYYSIFKPSKSDRWQGNLKRYKLAGTPLDIYDANNKLAVDKDTGFFNTEAQSFWSSGTDGRKVNVGGAGEKLPEPSKRKLYTYLGTNPAGKAITLDNSQHRLDRNNKEITPIDLGLNNSDQDRRNQLLDWIRDPSTWLGDPLHSLPGLVTYGCKQQDPANGASCPEDKQELAIFFGTNDGFIHGIDSVTGTEKFAFMPAELLPNLDKLETNAATDRTPGHGRPYGMDGSVTLWVNDTNKNGGIYGGYDTLNDNPSGSFLNGLNKGEFVYAYTGMRRGGSSYYALDVTSLDSPRLMWFIQGGNPGFEQLGQTWSKPVKTRIKIGGTIRDVLIFTGGYDPDQDQAKQYQTDTVGNAVYIVDARTGELIWSTSNNATATLRLNNMNYSIPGGVRVIDLNGDGLANQMLFADVGGQVWRLYINNCTASDPDGCAVADMNDIRHLVWPSDSNGDGQWDADEGVFAYLGPADKEMDGGKIQTTHSRRFFVEPDASLFRLNGSTHLAIAIGTGNRPDPLSRVNEIVQDRAYVMASPFYGNPGVTKSNRDEKNVPAHKKLKHQSGQLVDITTNLNVSPEDLFGNSSSDPRKGWFIDMESQEKVMTESVTFEEVVYFNTYLPSDDVSNTCNPVAGKARAYAVNLLTGLPVQSDDPDNPDASDRFNELANSGLPPTTSILFPEGSDDALICVGAECDPLEIGDDRQTTYWRQVQ